MKFSIFCQFLVLLLTISNRCDSTLSQSDKKSKKDKSSSTSSKDTKRGLTSQSVYMKGLVTTKINSKEDILQHYQSYHQELSFNNFDDPVLGYVTPWNGHGYDIAKR